MPESKRIFQAGRMNLDLDDRLIPNGEYRYGVNINIGRAEGADIGAIENLLGNQIITFTDGEQQAPENDRATCIGVYRDNGNERIYFFVTNNDDAAERAMPSAFNAIYEYDQTSGSIQILASGAWLNFHVNFTITGINLAEVLLLWTDNRNEPRKINILEARNDPAFYDDDNSTVIKYHPFLAPVITNASVATRTDEDGEPLPRSNFLQRRLVRFSYRFRFEDGEFSPLAPFSTTCFSPGTFALEANAPGLRDSGEVAGFLNEIQTIGVQVPIPDRQVGIEAVELIWKEQARSTLYILEDQPVTFGDTSVTFNYTSQDPFRALPPSQLTRVSDAVPRLAQSQEFAGGRIVYGNYLHQFNLPSIDFVVRLASDDDPDTPGDYRHPVFQNHSLKQGRTYQVGITLQDRFGRQTPIILSSSGSDTVATQFRSGTPEEVFEVLEVEVLNWETVRASAPWAYSYKIWVKQREQEYYNVFTENLPNTPSMFSGPDENVTGGFQRTGDTINKVPVDTTQAAGGIAVASTARLYPKLSTVTGEAGPNDVSIDSRLTVVDAINTTVFPSTFTAGTNDDILVWETLPFESELDIFFETSTGGLIPETPGAHRFPVDFLNCYLVPVGDDAHLEFNRIRAGFNEPFFDVGVRASLVVEEYAEERRFNALIHSSGFFNSRTGLNGLNQFNVDEGGLTLSLDPQDGSIQKLYAEDTQLIIWQEDKVSRSPIDKDFIYSAEGGAVPVTSNTQYLGTVAPYAGEYGISQDPESFAVYGTRKYFTDKNRGVVLRLANDGLQEISKRGMNNFFRDALRTSTRIIGSFDEYHDVYNLTINGNNYANNPDTDFATGREGYFTVAFEEDVQGWSSFKTFRQENGTTLNNRYYTFNEGLLYEHNSEIPGTRNTFYGQFRDSEVEFVFNDNPSLVKDFKTLGYEGDGMWECEFLETDSEGILPGSDTPEELNFGSLTLAVNTSGLTRANLVGPSRMTAEVNDTVTWIIYVEADTVARTFNNLNQATLVDPGGNEVTGTLNLAEGRIYWTITETIRGEDERLNYTISGSSASQNVGDLLVINLGDIVGENYRYSRGTVSFRDADFIDMAGARIPATARYNIVPNTGFYFSNITQIPEPVYGAGIDVVEDSYTGSSATGDNTDIFDLAFQVNRPTGDERITRNAFVQIATPIRYNNITFADPVVTTPTGIMYSTSVMQFLTNEDGEGPGMIATPFRLADPDMSPQARATSARLNLSLRANDQMVWTINPIATVTPAGAMPLVLNDEEDPSVLETDVTVEYTDTDREYSFDVTGGEIQPARLIPTAQQTAGRSAVVGGDVDYLLNEIGDIATLSIDSNLGSFTNADDNYTVTSTETWLEAVDRDMDLWQIRATELNPDNGIREAILNIDAINYTWANAFNMDNRDRQVFVRQKGPIFFTGSGAGRLGLPGDITLPAVNGRAAIQINVPIGMTATTNAVEGWLNEATTTTTAVNGYDRFNVILTADSNPGGQRTSDVTFTVGTETFTITITQNA